MSVRIPRFAITMVNALNCQEVIVVNVLFLIEDYFANLVRIVRYFIILSCDMII